MVLDSPTAAIGSVAFVRDGKTLLATDASRTLHRWDTVSGKEDASSGWPLSLRSAVAAARLSADGRLVVAPGADGYVILWDARTGEEKHSFADGARASALAPDGKRIVLCGTGGVRIVDAVTARVLTPSQPVAVGLGPLFSSDGRTVVFLAAEQGLMALSLFESATNQSRGRYLLGNTFMTCLAFAPDGRLLAAGGSDGNVTIFDLMNGKKVWSGTGHMGDVRALAFSPDGSLLASAGMDGSAVCWDATRFRPAVKPREMKTDRAATLWEDLAGENAVRAYAAHWELVEAPGEAIALLKQHLKPAGGERGKQFARWIADLEDEDFEVRQSASDELAKAGSSAEESIRRAMATNPPPETKRRLESLLEKLSTRVLSPEDRRGLRAIEILERITTPDARQLLESLAKGADAEPITVEAQESLARLKARTP
jgi:WD40 repeat protein